MNPLSILAPLADLGPIRRASTPGSMPTRGDGLVFGGSPGHHRYAVEFL